jgi:hypothetical protein
MHAGRDGWETILGKARGAGGLEEWLRDVKAPHGVDRRARTPRRYAGGHGGRAVEFGDGAA